MWMGGFGGRGKGIKALTFSPGVAVIKYSPVQVRFISNLMELYQSDRIYAVV